MEGGRRRNIHLAIIAIITIVIYLNTFSNQFVWDDNFFIVNWDVPKSLINLSEILRGATPEHQWNAYRPLTGVYYMIAYQMWGLNTFGYHLQGIIVHLANTLLVYFIMRHLTKRPLIPFFTSLLFGVHPMHAEVVNFMTSTYDWAALFLFLSFYGYLRSDGEMENTWYVLSIVCALLAFFTYELTLILPALVIFYDLVFRRFTWSALAKYLPFFLSSLFYVFIRQHVLSTGFRMSYLADSWLWTQFTMVKVWAKYIVLSIFPFNLSINHSISDGITSIVMEHNPEVILSQSIFDPQFIVSLLVFAGVLVFALYLYKRNPLASFAIGWFFLSLLPASNIVPNSFLMAERYAYVSILGSCIILAMCLDFAYGFLKKAGLKRVFYVVFFVLILSFSLTVIHRNTTWRDPYTLWEEAIRSNPESGLAHNNLGMHFFANGDLDQALKYYALGSEISPYYAISTKNVALVHLLKGDPVTAKRYIDDYLQYKTPTFDDLVNMAAIEYRLGNLDLAQHYYIVLLENGEYIAPSYLGLGSIALEKGYTRRAEEYFNLAIKEDQTFFRAYASLGTLYMKEGQPDLAIPYLEYALELSPDNPVIRKTLDEAIEQS